MNSYIQSVSSRFILFFSVLIFTACGSPQSSIEEPLRNRLVVAMDDQMPGYFVFGGESYGYQYDLFKAYADQKGIPLEVVSHLQPAEYTEKLNRGEVDFITTLSSHLSTEEQLHSIPIYTTSYVLLGSKKRAREAQNTPHFRLASFIGESRVLMCSAFKDTHSYGMLLDSLAQAEIYVSERNSFELIEALEDGQYDYLICEMSEAQLGCAFAKGVEPLYTFAEPVALSAVVASTNASLQADFARWLNSFRNSEEYATLNYLYFEKGIVRQMIGSNGRSVVGGGISTFDHLFKRICDREGYDWRLISAIAYSESRFDPTLVSHRGAQGLMQLMPRVARQFKDSGNLMDPENNVLLALKILSKIEKSLKFSTQTPESDRIRIVLACYNGGIGHVMDARNLARKYGNNPDAWSDVSQYLTLKSKPEYAQDEVVRNGRFIGRQTLAFVDLVMRKYEIYCRNVER